MLEFFGYGLILVLSVVLICLYPMAEFARGMASNPSAHNKSKGSCIGSLIGLILLGWWIWEVLV